MFASGLPGLLLTALIAVVVNFPLSGMREDAVTYMNLGMGLITDGRPAEALPALQKALEIKPTLAGAYYNTGRALMALKRPAAAVEQYELALKHSPDFGVAHAELGKYFYETEQADRAIPHLRQAIELVPDLPLLSVELAELLTARGESAAAIAVLRQARRVHPDDWLAANNLAWILATDSDPEVRNGVEAVQLAEGVAARELDPARSRPAPVFEIAILDVLAAAYAEQGRFDEAVRAIRRALDMARRNSDQATVQGLAARLQNYSNHQPFRVPRSPAVRGR